MRFAALASSQLQQLLLRQPKSTSWSSRTRQFREHICGAIIAYWDMHTELSGNVDEALASFLEDLSCSSCRRNVGPFLHLQHLRGKLILALASKDTYNQNLGVRHIVDRKHSILRRTPCRWLLLVANPSEPTQPGALLGIVTLLRAGPKAANEPAQTDDAPHSYIGPLLFVSHGSIFSTTTTDGCSSCSCSLTLWVIIHSCCFNDLANQTPTPRPSIDASR